MKGEYKMSRRILGKIGIVLTIIFIIIASVVWLYFHNEKRETTKKIKEYLTENNYQNDVKKEEILYDFKIGNYYSKLIFKDEPENYYEIYILDGKIDFTAYNIKKNEEITDPEKAKYISN